MKFTIKIVLISLITVCGMILTGFVFNYVSDGLNFARYNEVYNNATTCLSDFVATEMIGKERTAENYAAVIENVKAHDFKAIVVLSKSGAVLYSTSDYFKDAYINQLDSKGQAAFLDKKGGNVSVTINGEKGQLYFSSYNDFSNERIMGLLPESMLNKISAEALLFSFLEAFCFVIIAGAGCSVIVFSFKHRYDIINKVKPVNNYVLKVKKNGKIIGTNTGFSEQFGHTTIADKFKDKTRIFDNEVVSGRPMFFTLPDKNGEEKNLIFNSTASFASYKIVGGDVTDYVNEHDRLLYESRIDRETGLWNDIVLSEDWVKICSEKSFSAGLLVGFRVQNLEYYRMLFGETNLRVGVKQYANALMDIVGQYGKLYYIEDEAILLISNAENKEQFLKKLNEIYKTINKPLHVVTQTIKPDVRMGVVMLDRAKEDTELSAIFVAEKRALRIATQSERTPYYILRAAEFSAETHGLVTREGVSDLLRTGEVDVWFQPQYDIVDNRVSGVEALVRIVGPRASEISVQDFVEAAEKNGRILDLGIYIYEKAMDFARVLKGQNVSVSINVSPIQLMQMGFVETFMEAMKKRELEPGSVHIEIIEGTLIYSIQDVIRKLEILKKNGVDSEIDDFGIAYSSMYYLKKMPVSTLKIDKSFIDGITYGEADSAIVKNLINMTKDLGLECIAEGVETAEQVEKLRELGCRKIQGFYFGKAMPKEKVFEYIKEKNTKNE